MTVEDKIYTTPQEIPFNTHCQNCEIGRFKCNGNNHYAVGGAGPQDLSQVKLIIISDHPGAYEEKYGYPFVHNEVLRQEYEKGKRKNHQAQDVTPGPLFEKPFRPYLTWKPIKRCILPISSSATPV